MNKAILIGNIVRDIELRQTNSGKNIVDFTIAINNGKGRDADFINCQAWEKTADILAQYTSKGSKIAVDGSIKTTSYTNKDGQKIYKTFVQVYQVELLGNKNTTSEDYQQKNTNNEYNKELEEIDYEAKFTNSDLPF